MTLHLVLLYHWFDEIAAGRKRMEYRAITPYWLRRIWEQREDFFFVRFARGYTSVTLDFDVLDIDVGPCPNEGWDDDYYYRIHFA